MIHLCPMFNAWMLLAGLLQLSFVEGMCCHHRILHFTRPRYRISGWHFTKTFHEMSKCCKDSVEWGDTNIIRDLLSLGHCSFYAYDLNGDGVGGVCLCVSVCVWDDPFCFRLSSSPNFAVYNKYACEVFFTIFASGSFHHGNRKHPSC